VQTCGTWILCAYVFLLYRRCSGRQESDGLPRIAASPFLFRGLPAWSPGILQSPQVQARDTPGRSPGVVAWDTPEEKVRRTNSSKTGGGREAGHPQTQPGQAVDDDNGKGHGGIFANAAQALRRFGLSLPGAAVVSTPRSCQVRSSPDPAPDVEAIP